MSYRYRTVTVFGGSGFIGRHRVKRLARSGVIVRVPSRRPGQAAFLRTSGSVAHVVPMQTRVVDDASVAQAVQEADTVVNLIGILHESGNATFERMHVEVAARIARAAKAAGVERLLHMSALGADAHSSSAYARTKAAGEEAVRDAFPEATIFRPSVVFGPEDQFFNRFAAMARLAPALPLPGGGGTRFQPVYVGDVADAMMAALNDPATRGVTFELGGPRIYTFRELMEITLREIGRKRFLVPLSWRITELQGRILGALPNPPLTRDQVELLKTDNVVSGKHPGLADLGIRPSMVEIIIPSYLDRFRVGGRFAGRQPVS